MGSARPQKALWLADPDELVDLVHQAQIGLDLGQHLLGGRGRFALCVEPRDQHALTRYLILRLRDRRARSGELRKYILHRRNTRPPEWPTLKYSRSVDASYDRKHTIHIKMHHDTCAVAASGGIRCAVSGGV